MAACRSLKEVNSRLKKKYPDYDIQMYEGERGSADDGTFFFLDGSNKIDSIESITASSIKDISWSEVVYAVSYAVTKYEVDQNYRRKRYEGSLYTQTYRRNYNR